MTNNTTRRKGKKKRKKSNRDKKLGWPFEYTGEEVIRFILVSMLLVGCVSVSHADGGGGPTVTLEMFEKLEARVKALESAPLTITPGMPYKGTPDSIEIDTTPHQCGICKKWFKTFRTGISCAVYHRGSSCCHYNETEITDDEQFIEQGKKDVQEMRRIRERGLRK